LDKPANLAYEHRHNTIRLTARQRTSPNHGNIA
jgi:hypothetical protein